MLTMEKNARVLVYSEPVHMGKSFEALAAIVRTEMKHELKPGDYFFFVSSDRRRAKILFATQDGMCLIYKRLSAGFFPAPWTGLHTEIGPEDVIGLLAGMDVAK